MTPATVTLADKAKQQFTAKALDQFSQALATQPAFTYTHHWQAGDLVIWDNRTTMHRARRYDDTGEVRDMRRTTIEGVATVMPQAA